MSTRKRCFPWSQSVRLPPWREIEERNQPPSLCAWLNRPSSRQSRSSFRLPKQVALYIDIEPSFLSKRELQNGLLLIGRQFLLLSYLTSPVISRSIPPRPQVSYSGHLFVHAIFPG